MNRLSFKYLTTQQVAALGILSLAVLVALQIFFFLEQKRQVWDSRMWVAHSHQEILQLGHLLTKIKDAELGQRGYLLTGDNNFLDIYFSVTEGVRPHQIIAAPDGGVQTIGDIINTLRPLVVDDPAEAEQFHKLQNLVSKKMAYIQLTLDMYHEKGHKAAIAFIQHDDNRRITDEIRLYVAQMIRLEQLQLEERLLEDQKSEDLLSAYIMTAAMITYSILLLTILIIVGFFSRGRRIETQLHLKEAQFRAAATGSIDGFFLFRAEYDRDGKVSDLLLDYVNPVAERMLQKTLDVVLGQPIDKILAPESETVRTFDIYRGIMERQQAMEREYTATVGPLEGHTLLKQAVPLPNGIAIFCRDITERKHIERMKNEFISTVSHELRTPLTSIRGSLGLIIGGVAGGVPDKVKNLLTIAYNNCERLTRLINDILDIEKIEAGQIKLDTKPLLLLPLIEQVIAGNQGYADTYGVRVVFERDGGDADQALTEVVADPDRLTQVLTNLLSNAVKFSPSTETVTIRFQQRDSHVRIAIVDKGPGIPLNFQDKVFQKFAQADSSDTRAKGGTGLGLAITKNLVEQMGGQIGFETAVGRGTVFYFTVPCAVRSETAYQTGATAPQDRPRVLHVENDMDIAQILSLTLAPLAELVHVTTVQQARDFLTSQSCDLAIVDVDLPDGSGIDLLPLLKKANGASIPVVLFTACDVSAEIHGAVQATLIKSRTSEQALIDTVRRIITQKRRT